jgi:hypothetical protein
MVERDFSVMSRILTGLQNCLTTQYLEQLMRRSIEEPSNFDNDLKDEIVDCWKKKRKLGEILVKFTSIVFFLGVLFFFRSVLSHCIDTEGM